MFHWAFVTPYIDHLAFFRSFLPLHYLAYIVFPPDITFQYCLWDHFKELESMELKRSMRLSKFAADMFVSFTLSLAVLKVVDFTDTTQMIPKRIKHFQMLFEAIFEHPDSLVWNVFTRIAANPECESLRQGIEFFINKYVVSSRNSLANKSKIVKKALASVDGALMDVR